MLNASTSAQPAPTISPTSGFTGAPTSTPPSDKKMSPQANKRRLGLIIGGALLVVLLIGSGVGLYLLRQSQNIAPKAVDSQFTEAKDCSMHGSECKCTFCVPGQPFNCQWDESGASSGGRCGSTGGGSNPTPTPPSNVCNGTNTAQVCMGNTPGSACNGFPGVCQANGTDSAGRTQCGCVASGSCQQNGGSCYTGSTCNGLNPSRTPVSASSGCSAGQVCCGATIGGGSTPPPATKCSNNSDGTCAGRDFNAACTVPGLSTGGTCTKSASSDICTCQANACTNDASCNASSYCDGGTCKAKKTTGSCTRVGECATGYSCTNGQCTASTGGTSCTAIGQSCGTNGNGYCGSTTTGYTCYSKKTAGQACESNFQCLSSNCNNSVCTDSTGCTQQGGNCTTITGKAGFCSLIASTQTWSCGEKQANGAACAVDYLCQSGVCSSQKCVQPVCGNFKCEPGTNGAGETSANCTVDCGGNGSQIRCTDTSSCRAQTVADAGGNQITNPLPNQGSGYICSATPYGKWCVKETSAQCGNNACETNETVSTCPADCYKKETDCSSDAACGTGMKCVLPQGICVSTAAVCGNNVCDYGESKLTCSQDCGTGGAKYCDRSGPNTNQCTDKLEGSVCNTTGGQSGACTITIPGGANTECICETAGSTPTPPPGGGSTPTPTPPTGEMCPDQPTVPAKKYLKFTCDNGCALESDGFYRCYENRVESDSLLTLDGACGQVDVLSGDTDATYCGYTEYTCDQPRCQRNQSTATPTPTPPTGPMCLAISMSNPAPKLNDTVTFTCGTVPGVTQYKFRVVFPDNRIVELASNPGTPNQSQNFTINSAGTYKAQCTICPNGQCHDFEPLGTSTNQ